ncbi:MAG TPA: HIRAN domain-containing protein [Xanthobacteraceae bacterium]|nr:HIRAN domain-containing protein [Xanthobacteraceae bacterium]
MEHWLEEVREPKVLVLAWQAPDHMKDRFRWAVGEIMPKGDGFILRYFAPGSSFEDHNGGRRYEEMIGLGYAGYAAFPTKVREHTAGVIEAFNRRLPPRGRSDFAEYMKHFRLRNFEALSNFALLGKTEATLPSDGFSLVDPLDGENPSCDILLEVAGHRYYAKNLGNLIHTGAGVEISPEPTNEHDSNAVRFSIEGLTIGYVNRIQTAAFNQWLKSAKIRAVIERVNGKPERPRVFLFVKVRPAGAQIAA